MPLLRAVLLALAASPARAIFTPLKDSNIREAAVNWVGQAAPNYADATYGPVAEADTSQVTTMKQIFSAKPSFTGDLSAWNVASATTMVQMFNGAHVFNSGIGSWNVAHCATMDSMLSEAAIFDQNLATWNVASVTSMYSMFSGAAAFNQNVKCSIFSQWGGTLQTAHPEFSCTTLPTARCE
jgi:hypothetical protein